MADYSTHSSCIFDVGTAENVTRRRHPRRLRRATRPVRGLGTRLRDGGGSRTGPGALWIHSDEYGEPEDAVLFVLRCAEALDPQGVWGFTWRESCSKPAWTPSAAARRSSISASAKRSSGSAAATGSSHARRRHRR